MSAPEVASTADHWWWRPGWAPGRRFYTWHCTFVDQPAVCAQAEVYRAALAGVPGLDLVDDRWLHLTLQGLGFADEVTVGDIDAIVAAARGRLAAVDPFDSWIDRPEVTAEAVRWELPGPFVGMRRAVRAAVAEVWGTVPEPEEGFAAHVSIAYSHAVRPAAPVRRALAGVPARRTPARIAAVDLIVLGRDEREYRWTPVARVPLGAG